MRITINNQQSFRSGLNSNYLQFQNKLNIKDVEKYFERRKISADFNSNKPIATSCFLSFSILENFSKILKNFKFWSPSINSYDKEMLLANINSHNFCLPEPQFVLKGKPIYPQGSIFYKNQNSLEEMNYANEMDYAVGKRSSSHFLAEIIHEMLHVMYLDFIKQKYPDANKQMLILQELQTKNFSTDENEIIKKTIGTYATTPLNQYHEVFAETFTQLICNSISEKDCIFVKNPLEGLKTYSKDFRLILKKTLEV